MTRRAWIPMLTLILILAPSLATGQVSAHGQGAGWPVPPSARSERTIPRALEEIILACLAKPAERRPFGAAALRDARRSRVAPSAVSRFS